MWAYLFALIVGAAGGAYSTWQVQEWRWTAAAKRDAVQSAKDLHRKLERAQTASGAYEAKRTTNEIQYRTVTVTVEKVIEHPVYLSQCMDADGLRILNEQIAGNPNPGKLGLKLPGS